MRVEDRIPFGSAPLLVSCSSALPGKPLAGPEASGP